MMGIGNKISEYINTWKTLPGYLRQAREEEKVKREQGQTVKLQAPDGTIKEVPANVADHYIKLGAKPVEDKGLLEKAWDWTGKPLLNLSKITATGLNKGTVPMTSPSIYYATTPQGIEASQFQGDPAVAHATARLAEGFTSPRSLALALATGGTSRIVSPMKDIAVFGLAGDTGMRGIQAAKESAASPNPNERRAGALTSAADILTAILLGKGAFKREPAASMPAPVEVGRKGSGVALPASVRPGIVTSTRPVVSEIPQSSTPWYELPEYQKPTSSPSKGRLIPEWSRPAPTPEYPGQRNMGLFTDEVKGLNAGHADWRAKENWPGAKVSRFFGPEGEEGFAKIYDFKNNSESGPSWWLRQLDINSRKISALDDRWNELRDKKSSLRASGDLNPIIRKTLNNQMESISHQRRLLYSDRTDILKSDRQPEGKLVTPKFGNEEGFASVSRRPKAKALPGEETPFEDLTGQAWMMPDGSVVKVKDHWSAMEEFLGKPMASFKDAADQGMIRIRKAPRTLDLETFAPEATPEQRGVLLKYARENPDTSLTWEGRGKDWTKKWGTDWDSLKKRLFGEEGFAKVDRNQKGFDFAPMNIPGQSKRQIMSDLYSQILQVPDSSVSKRDMFGLNKKPVKASSEGALFRQPTLPEKPDQPTLDRQYIDQYLAGKPLSEAVEANKQTYDPELDMQIADQVLGKNWRFQR